MTTQTLRYPTGTLLGDYLRAGAGVGVGLGVLATMPAGWAVGVVFGGLAGMFGVFGVRTIERHVTRVAVSEDEIARAALDTRVIPWREVSAVKLRYYGTKRQERQSGGFMQLTLRGAGTKMVFESNLEGFDYLVWRAAQAARRGGVSVDPTTAGNMLQLGIDADSETPPPAHVGALHDALRHTRETA